MAHRGRLPLSLAIVLSLSSITFAAPAPPLRIPRPNEVYASYWTAEPGWHTELQIRNNYKDQDLDVQPVLRTANGIEIPLAKVTVRPEGSKVVTTRTIP